jgi:acyl-CoA synthetase (AMP-forming)/AMP-acid ligase II
MASDENLISKMELLLSKIDGKRIPGPPKTVHDIITKAAKENPNTPAVVCMHQPAEYLSSISGSKAKSDYLKWTFEELLYASHATAVALAKGGLRPGMKIVAYLETGIEFHIMMRAALELNCPFAPLNPKCVGNSREVKHYINLLQPAVILASSAKVAEKIEKAAPEGVAKALVRLICAESSQGWQELGAFVGKSLGSNEAVDALEIERSKDDVVLILFTSGTTGLPKGFPYTNLSRGTLIQAVAEAFDPIENSINCHHVAVFHRM